MSNAANNTIVAKAVALAAAALLACAPMAYADPDDETQQGEEQQDSQEGIPGQIDSGVQGGQGVLVMLDGVKQCVHKGQTFPGVHSVQYLGPC